MTWGLLVLEQLKVFKRRMLWIELIILAVVIAVLDLILYVVTTVPEAGTGMPPGAIAAMRNTLVWPNGIEGSLSMAGGSGFGGLMVMVLVATVVSQEYTWRTLNLWVSRGISRRALFGARFLAMIVPIVLVVVVTVLSGAIVTGILSVVVTGGLDVAGVDWPSLAWNSLLTAYSILPYAAITFLVAVATRSVAASLAASIGYSLIFEGLVVQLLGLAGGWLGQVQNYLPAGLTQSVLSVNKSSQAMMQAFSQYASTSYFEPWLGAIGVALYVVAFLAAAMWISRRQDLTS